MLVRWPLLGVVVGTVVGHGLRSSGVAPRGSQAHSARSLWRRDPDLLRAYGRASWIWVGQYLVRIAVYAPLWLAGQTVALAAMRIALSWPMVAACVAVSWWVLRRSLPPDHPGLRYPRVTP